MPPKSAPSRVNATRNRVKDYPPCQLPALFASWLGLPVAEPAGLYDSVRTFWLFLYQILTSDGSCQKTVDEAVCWIRSQTGVTPSSSTSAYCQARARLSTEWTIALLRRLVTSIEDKAAQLPGYLWYGHRVVVVDGSSCSMPDTAANQKQWPQPSRQKTGCGFPVVRLVALFSLATGALLESATGPLTVSERELFRQMWRYLRRGDVVLSDKGFGSFGELYFLAYRGVEFVARLNPTRSSGVRHVKELGKGDRLVEWVRIKQCPDWVEKAVWQTLPETMTVREITYTVAHAGFRTHQVTVITTLLDPDKYPPEAFAELYLRRWKGEIWFRDLKTTMGMDVLTTKSPEMIRKELLTHAIGYNLIRALVLESRLKYEFDAHRISFKGCLNLVRTWAPMTAMSENAQKQQDMVEGLLYYISRQIVRGRPGRSEPRAVKRRPKNYQRLTAPREEFKEVKHRNKYTKEKAKKSA